MYIYTYTLYCAKRLQRYPKSLHPCFLLLTKFTSDSMAPIWSYQPFKGLWTAWILGIAPLYISLLSLYYIPKRSRPHPSWSFQTSLGKAIYYQAFNFLSKIRVVPTYNTNSAGLNERFVMVNPASSDISTGILKHERIKRVPFGAIWFPRAPTAEEILSCKIFLHRHLAAVVSSPARYTTSKSTPSPSMLNTVWLRPQRRNS